jgi:hypothetical protein
MSELNEKRWAVISERGVEASELIYDDALKLSRKLGSEKVHSLCIVTSEAAQRDAHQSAIARSSSKTRTRRAQR